MKTISFKEFCEFLAGGNGAIVDGQPATFKMRLGDDPSITFESPDFYFSLNKDNCADIEVLDTGGFIIPPDRYDYGNTVIYSTGVREYKG